MALAVEAALGHADRHGLRKADYSIRIRSEEPRPGKEAAEYDLTLSRALFRYAFDVRNGRFAPNTVYKDIRLSKNDFDFGDALGRALQTNMLAAFLDDLPPPHPEYWRLVVALERYRAIAENGGWLIVPGDEKIDIDGSDARLGVLIKRLEVDDPELASNPHPSTAELTDAVRRFQARYGIEADGQIARRTLAELNVSVFDRVAQIVANMERWRWVPRVFEPRYIVVNVPDQSVDYIRDGQVQLSSRAIVGRKTSPTPILRTTIDAVIVNPPWDIPGDIAARTLLPQLRKNPNYLASRNMVVVNGPAGDPRGTRINWPAVSAAYFPYHIRQIPPNSALGVLMLNSPNDFDVYLHDTPGKKAFELEDRTISNGCVRVEAVFAFASLALTGDPAVGEDLLKKHVASRQTRRVALEASLPVYMLYWTAIAEDDGRVAFRPDRYQRDRRLIEVLARANGASNRA
jgi:murein L,D-transpeptidase YcbB/YkuD